MTNVYAKTGMAESLAALGLPVNGVLSRDVVVAARRRLSLRFHPDKNQGAGSDTFARVQEAFKIVMKDVELNEKKRQKKRSEKKRRERYEARKAAERMEKKKKKKKKKPDQSLVADPCNERFRLAYGFQSDKTRLD